MSWKAFFSFSENDKKKFLQFVIGSNSPGVGGFSRFNIKIRKKDGSLDLLPSAHTCFYTLDLPPYPSSKIMREKLLIAVQNCGSFEMT